MFRKILPLAFGALLVAAVPSFAQNADGTPMRIRGTIAKLDGKSLLVKSRDGQDLGVTLADDVRVLGIVKAKAADIKQGDFVGVAALAGSDGKLHAQEVLIFPEAARGSGEGHYPWDLTPGSTMTNATVAEVESGSTDRMLKLKHKDGANDIELSPDIPVVSFAPADASLLKPGAAVFVPALKKADGSIVAARVIAEKDGVKPPM
jgi:hypothetical protein